MSKNAEAKTLKEGEMLVFEYGEYSDFSYAGPFVVKKDYDSKEAVERYRQKVETKHHTIDGFISFLESEGYVAPAERAHTWYLGGYDFEPDWS